MVELYRRIKISGRFHHNGDYRYRRCHLGQLYSIRPDLILCQRPTKSKLCVGILSFNSVSQPSSSVATIASHWVTSRFSTTAGLF